MGKIIGLLIGAFFGPVTAFFGFLIGSIVDIFSGKNVRFYVNLDPEDLVKEAFPILAAAVTRKGGVAKESVRTTRDIATSVFDIETAKEVMQKYKNYVEKGYSEKSFYLVCEQILYTLDYHSRVYLLNLLFLILKARDVFSLDEVYIIERIAQLIGIDSYDFELMLRDYRTKGARYQRGFTRERVNESDPYQVLGVNKNASTEEIKKQYRLLCKKYHPDVTSTLSEKEREDAKIKLKEIMRSYEKIKKERNFK